MSTSAQLERLITCGVPELAGISIGELAAGANGLPDEPDSVLVVHPSLVPAAKLATLLWLNGRPGFVVDMSDLGEFVPIEGVTVPDRPLYLVRDVERGDEMRNWSPTEALPEITGRGRSPLTISEGISWLLHQPGKLARNQCFMTIASRKNSGRTLDSRTPAIWISGRTGRSRCHPASSHPARWPIDRSAPWSCSSTWSSSSRCPRSRS